MVENPGAPPVACPRCGDEMNRHAEKIDTQAIADEGGPEDGSGGVLKEFHTCAGCRFVLERASP